MKIKFFHTNVIGQLFAVFCLLFWQNSCLADDFLTPAERAWLQAHPDIRVAISPDYPPISFLDAAGKHTGLEHDYLSLLESRIGYQFKKVIPTLADRAAISPEGKKVDMLAVYALTEERIEHWHFSKPYLDFPVYLITHEDAPSQFSLENAQKKAVSVVSHYAAYEFITKKYPNLIIDKVADTCVGLQHVSFGISAGMVADLPVANWCAKQYHLKNLKIAQATGFHYEMGLASRKDWPIFSNILEKGLASITQQERDAIYLRWNENAFEKTTLQIYKNWILAALLGLLGFALFRLFQWDKKLKNAFDNRLKLNNVCDLTDTKSILESKIAMRVNVITLITIVSIIIVASAFIDYFYEGNQGVTLQVIEVSLVFFALFGGLVLGSIWRRIEADKCFNRLLNQTSAREWVERKISLSEDRLIKQQQALSLLSQNPNRKAQSLNEIFREYTQTAAETLDVERVSVWLYTADNTELECIDFYTKSNNTHRVLQPVPAAEIPKYFQQLIKHRVIAADDAMQHPATQELTDGYLQDNNIGAILDGGIWLDGNAVGVFCHEHVGGTREWTSDEKTFAGSLADLARVTLETCKRREAEQLLRERSVQLEQMVQARTLSLQESNQRFSYVVQEAPIAILIIDRSGNIVDLNDEAVSASGYSREELLGKHFIRKMVAKESRKQATIMAERTLRGENFRHVELLLQNAAGEKYEYECSVGMSVKSATGDAGQMVAIAQNISQQKALQKSLIQAREAAESADRTKSMFVASMSHELRTPLNSIIGFLGVVLQGISGELNPAQKSHLDRAYQSSKHLLLLISDVLDLSKIEAGFLHLHTEKFELKPLLIELEHAVQHLLVGKELALSIDCAAKLQVTSDRKRLYQVLLNVLSNAVKYTEQGSIKVKARIEDNQLIISCKDTGIGIEELDFHKLFQPFERVESALKIKTPGTGLGLYLSHKILTELLSGRINVQSKLGQGSTFTIIMPVNTPLTVTQKMSTLSGAHVEEPVL